MSEIQDSIINAMRSCIGAHQMLMPGESLVLGVSGGSDSTALLHLLHRLGFKVVAAHLNHLTRGAESDADEAFVRALAANLGVPFECMACDILAEAGAAGVSFEAHARARRYAFFAGLAKAHGVRKIATAHHADDQAETVLMRILRGTGPEGLAGIPYKRVWEDLEIVRPLLDCRHMQLVAWLQENKLAWREDASNRDTYYTRNRIRHELLPMLEEEYNPRLKESLLRLAEAQRCENMHWEEGLGDILAALGEAIKRADFRAWPEAFQRRALLRLAQQLNIELSHDRVLALCGFICHAHTGAYMDMGAGWQFYSGAEEVLLCAAKGETGTRPSAILPLPGDCAAFGKCFAARYLDAPPAVDLKTYCNAKRQVFDADKLQSPLLIRGRRDGDTLAPFGMEGLKKVSDLLVDKKIPAPHRGQIPLVFCGDTLVWVVGVAPSQVAAVTPATMRYLQIEVCDAPE